MLVLKSKWYQSKLNTRGKAYSEVEQSRIKGVKVCDVISNEHRINQTWDYHGYYDLQLKKIDILNKAMI